jgi:hypothetical protein
MPVGDLQPIIYVVAWQGCGIGTFVANLDLDCGLWTKRLFCGVFCHAWIAVGFLGTDKASGHHCHCHHCG